MFTGIVEELGWVEARDGGHLRFAAPRTSEDTKIGDSIAVNGCCVTVTEVGAGWWEADAVDETLARTNLDDLRAGDPVNLERPVRVADRLGGHLVQGHVDAVGEIVEPAPDLRVRAPVELMRYIVEKGSITVDGCSLTVVQPLDDGFTVAVIPHTVAVTTLGSKGPGDRVNLEVDVVAKYVERLISPSLGMLRSGELDRAPDDKQAGSSSALFSSAATDEAASGGENGRPIEQTRGVE